ncbi:WXG100 family type VII secretion target [Micromonospora citrea]|uniref:WXG100 family type VII secretion target n=2 Tax=Micromonosporaceae TaxID=28056 RepID=A0A1C6US12_9ACTN|nr:WXG100 family type VII secretion target [Micromonospora citrea]
MVHERRNNGCPRRRGAIDEDGGDSTMTMRTDTGLMVKTEGDVDAVADRLTSNLNGLMDQLTPLYDQWKGAGAGSFQQVRERFDQDMARLNVALRAIAEAVGSAGKDYDVSDDEIRSDMDSAGATAGQITAALKL